MTDHVAVGEVHANEPMGALFQIVHHHIRDLARLHLRLAVKGHVVTGYLDPALELSVELL